MRNYKDISGMRFGRLIALEPIGTAPHGKPLDWLCKCDCGHITVINGSRLRNGSTKSCGCLQRELSSERMRKRSTKHGDCISRLYSIWSCMKNRCLCENNTHFDDYGGRGITVCDKWKDNFEVFKSWAISHGYMDSLTLDRIDNDGNYEPKNCRWVTRKEQAQNRRTTHMVEFKGEVKPLSEWEVITGISASTLRQRLYKAGWSVEDAFSKPIGSYRKRKPKQKI